MPQLRCRGNFNLVEYLRRTGRCVWGNRDIVDYRYRSTVVDLWDIGASV
jgi:hypothetical protein